MYSLDLRPRNFNDIVGQKLIIQNLKNRSKTMDFPQVILLEGSTGSGKTTTAQIIAQLLNCQAPITKEDGTHEACQECPSCKDIISGKFGRDTRVFDCAGMVKEDVLGLKQKLSVSPMYDKNKIFILDEAQNLGNATTKGALLLLLEKVYKHAYIIMNTMDISKFDTSIIGRTQRYSFKAIKEDDIADYLINTLLPTHDPKSELPDTMIEVLYTVATLACGSLREAVQLYEQCITTPITTKEELISYMGVMDEKTAYETLSLLVKKNKKFFEDFENYKKKENNQERIFNSFLGISWDALYKSALFEMNPDTAKSPFYENFYSSLNNTGNVKELLEIYSNMFNASSGNITYNFFMTNILLKFYKPMPNGVSKPPVETKPPLPIRGRK